MGVCQTLTLTLTAAAITAGVVSRGEPEMEALLAASSVEKRLFLLYAATADGVAAAAERAARGMTEAEAEVGLETPSAVRLAPPSPAWCTRHRPDPTPVALDPPGT